MNIHFFPQTKSGRWAGRGMAAFVIFLFTGMLVVSLGEQGGETIFDNLKISIPMILAGVSAIGALVAGLVSIFKNKERSVLVFLAALIGLLVTFFLIGEFTFPH